MKKDYSVIPILQEKSNFFCGGKWQELYLYLNHGLSNSCHHPLPHEIPEELLSDPYTLHNTPHKLKMQQLMMAGHRPNECHMCWQIEDADPEAVSDRMVKSQIYADSISTLHPDPHHVPRFIEVVFDNYCNLTCSYCDSGQSSSWATRITQQPLPLETDHRHLYSKVHIQPGSTKPAHLDAWLRWWPEIKHRVDKLKVSGGEPLMSPNFWQFAEYSASPTTNFSINSNFATKTQLIQKFIDYTSGFKSVLVSASVDAVGPIAEYARQGLDYELFLRNIEYYFNNSDSRFKFNLQSTVNIFSVWGFIDKLNLSLELKRRYPDRMYTMYTTVVKFPEFQSVLLLPEATTQRMAAEIEQWLAQHETELELNEYSFISKIATYLKHRPAHVSQIDQHKLKFDFKQFLLYYNSYSQHNYADIYPAEFVDWVDSIK